MEGGLLVHICVISVLRFIFTTFSWCLYKFSLIRYLLYHVFRFQYDLVHQIFHCVLGTEKRTFKIPGSKPWSSEQRGLHPLVFKRGMLWSEFNPTVSKLIARFPPPAMIIIQLGSNDLGTCKSIDLIQNIEMCLLLHSTRIIWSDILMRKYWHCAHNGTAIERARKRINSAVNKFVKNDGHCVIHHPNIRAREKNFYRFDGTHLSDIGVDIYLNNIQGAVETFMSSNQTRSFPLN